MKVERLIQIKDRLNASIVEHARIAFEIDDLIKELLENL